MIILDWPTLLFLLRITSDLHYSSQGVIKFISILSTLPSPTSKRLVIISEKEGSTPLPSQVQPVHKCFKPWAPISYLNISCLSIKTPTWLPPSYKPTEERREKEVKLLDSGCMLPLVENLPYTQLAHVSVLLRCPYYSTLKYQLVCLLRG